MISKIFKYPMMTATETFNLPEGAEILHVGQQAGGPVLWAKVDPEANLQERTFKVVMTGEPFDSLGLEHLGTVMIGPLVVHVFEVH